MGAAERKAGEQNEWGKLSGDTTKELGAVSPHEGRAERGSCSERKEELLTLRQTWCSGESGMGATGRVFLVWTGGCGSFS